MPKIYNFSAGPAILPHDVLQIAQSEMLNWHDTGLSVMEMSHRGKEYMHIIHQAEANLRTLMSIPYNYKVLFLQGGATLQFSMIPMNLSSDNNDQADYFNTGIWSEKAIEEAQKYLNVNVVAKNHKAVPATNEWRCSPNAKYLHYTSNETIGGVEFFNIPQNGDVPVVCDMSSDILSRPIDVSKFGLIYAGAQKNIGPAGLTVVIIRDDLITKPSASVPKLLSYKTYADNESMYNTPPTYAIYIAGLVFEWLLKQGGLPAIHDKNLQKAKILYDYLDQSDFYLNDIEHSARSIMNIPFWLKDDSLNSQFLKEAEAQGLVQLKGHRVAGGMRASIYNAMPIEGVQHLVEFMDQFAKNIKSNVWMNY